MTIPKKESIVSGKSLFSLHLAGQAQTAGGVKCSRWVPVARGSLVGEEEEGRPVCCGHFFPNPLSVYNHHLDSWSSAREGPAAGSNIATGHTVTASVPECVLGPRGPKPARPRAVKDCEPLLARLSASLPCSVLTCTHNIQARRVGFLEDPPVVPAI